MRVFACCAASFRDSVRKAAGVDAVLSPPLTMQTFDPASISGYDFIYFKLHGLPDEVYWYGDSMITAMSADQVRQADLGGAVIFVANCHLYRVEGLTLEPGPMLEALFEAGATAVVGGSGENFAPRRGVHGADVLGRAFRRACGWGFGVDTAFFLAGVALKRLKRKRLSAKQRAAVQDALGFRLFTRSDV